MSTRRLSLAVLVVGLALVSGGCLQMTVTKQVIGGTWEHPFTVHVACSSPTGPVQHDFVFDAGNIGQARSMPVDIREGTTCTWTEPQSAGATTVSIACENPPAGATCTSAPGSLSITVPPSSDREFVNIIVTNCNASAIPASLSTKRSLVPLPQCGCFFSTTFSTGFSTVRRAANVGCGAPI